VSVARQKVLILGGGFAGLATAQTLDAQRFEVTLLDRRNFHLFQPLLYQVATGSMDASDIATPLREILETTGVLVRMEDVVRIEIAERVVKTASAASYAYDYLIVATGVSHSYFGHEEWRNVAPGLKTLEDAFKIRAKVLSALELAERQPLGSDIKRQLRFIVIGGGPTGIELAGAIGELTGQSIAREFSRFNPGDAEIILIEAGPRILAPYSSALAANAVTALGKLGVEVRCNCKVTAVSDIGVVIQTKGGEEIIECATVIWAAGVQVSPLGAHLIEVAGITPGPGGRIQVDADFRLPSHPEIFAIGDLAAYAHQTQPLPGLAPAASQAGKHVAQLLNEGKVAPFHYNNQGQLAVVGRNAAVGIIWGREVHGNLAWLLWLLVHIRGLIGFDVKLKVMLGWGWKYFTARFGTRLITRVEDAEQR